MGLNRTRHFSFVIEFIHSEHVQSTDISYLLCFYSKMVRSYKRKKPAIDKSKMKEAVLSVRRDKMPIRITGINEALTSKASTSKALTSSQMEQESDEEDWSNTCCICNDALLVHERFKVCIECRHKAHVNCVGTTDTIFTCINCFSEEDSDYEDE